jgi:hypothetical protein
MAGIAKVLLILAVLGFLLAVASRLSLGIMMGVSAQGFSNGCTNLALIAIGISMIFPKNS